MISQSRYTAALISSKSLLNTHTQRNLIENLGIGLYTGADDVTDYENTYYVGTDLSYTYSNITFGLGLEYAEATDGFNYDNGGFNIVPYASVAW